MRRVIWCAILGCLVLSAGAAAQDAPPRRITVKDYRNRMKAGWLGQMAGVAFGAPTEFKYKGVIIPADKCPRWKPDTINGSFGQDDLYVEMTFLRTLEVHGLDVSIRQAGIDWANSGYPLWHANEAARSNLRKGIAPPDSGHPQFNEHADDIDYQIEADFSGLVAPGMPNTAIALGEKFGRLMNYGDGLYAGQFIGGCYAEAFFESDPARIVEAGLRCIPEGSQYAEAIRDVLKWWKDNPEKWEVTWQKIDDKYQRNPEYRKFSCDKRAFNIDAKINGAYVVLGLLYGGRDPEKSMAIACRAGQDSDCNPSSTAGILFTSIGFEKLPATFKEKLDESKFWSHTEYNFPKLIAACEKVARQSVTKSGGKIETVNGEEVMVIPAAAPKPSKLEQCWSPGPIADSKFTPEEMAQIKVPPPGGQGNGGRRADMVAMAAAVDKLAPGWKVANCGRDMNPGMVDFAGKKNVLLTHPLDRDTPCILSRQVEVPAGKKTTLKLTVGHHPDGDWVLIVKADGKELLNKVVGLDTAKNGWMDVTVDLSPLAGKTVNLELLNQPNGWSWEGGYWAAIVVE